MRPSLSDIKSVRSLDDLKSAFGLIPCMIGDLVIDLVQSIEVDYTYNVTHKPIDRGFVSDARVKLPTRIMMTCVLVNSIENFTPQELARQSVMGTFSADSWKQKRDYLLEMKEENIPLQIITPTQQFDHMMIEHLTLTRDTALDALFFEIELIEVRILDAEWEFADIDFSSPKEDEKDEPTERRTQKAKKPTRAIPEEATTVR